MANDDGLTAFDGFTRRAAVAGMFNGDQLDHMRHLSSLPSEAKCRCGWGLARECYGCNHADFRRHGITHDDAIRRYWGDPSFGWYRGPISILDYRLPNGCMTGYRGAVEWVGRAEAAKREG